MRALAGPAMLLVMVGGFAIYKAIHHDEAPSRAFSELELAAADLDHTGTCYALGTVLVANGIYGNALRTWSMPDEHDDAKWMLTLERVIQDYNGPRNEFQKFTFERHGEMVRLVAVDASKGYPTELEKNIDRLLEAPHDRHSTPVDRCLGHRGRGYHYPPDK